ncbi:MAG: copper chaperone PCu(A)C [Salinibacter sp.]
MHRSAPRFVALVLGLMSTGLLLWGCQGDSSSSEEASAPPLPDGELAIEDPWVRPAPAGSSSALYMTIANGLNAPDTLTDIDAPIIDSVQVYDLASDTTDEATAVGTLASPAQERVSLTPDGRSVGLFGLQQPLAEGETLVLNLQFAQSGLQRIQVPIRSSPPNEDQ